MADTGWIEFTSASQSGGDVAWSSLTNMLTNSGTNAFADLDAEYSHTAALVDASTELAAAIASGSTIDGVEIEISATTEDGGPTEGWDTTVQLIVGGTQTGTNKASGGTEWGDSSVVTRTFGGATDVWGTGGLTRAQIIATNFGVAVEFLGDGGAATMCRVYLVRVKVYYSAAAPDETATGAFDIGAVTVDGATNTGWHTSGILTAGAVTVDGTVLLQQTLETSASFNLPDILVEGYAAHNIGLIEDTDLSLPAITVAGAGSVLRETSTAIEVGAVTLSGSAGLFDTAAGAFTVGSVTLSGTANREYSGTSGMTFPAVTVRGRGGALRDAAGVIEIGAVTLAATGYDVDSIATGELTLLQAQSFLVDGVATVSKSGTGAFNISAVTLSGATSATPPPEEAAGALTLGAVTLSGVASDRDNSHSGSGALTVGSVTLSGAASYTTSYTGSGAITLPSVGVLGRTSHIEIQEVSGAFEVPSVEVSGAALNAKTAVAAFDVAAVTVDGFVPTLFEAPGTFSIGTVTLSGATHIVKVAAGTVPLPALEVSGEGRSTWRISGAFELPSVTMSSAFQYGFNTRGAITLLPFTDLSGALYREIPGVGGVTLHPVDVRAAGFGDDLDSYQWYEVREVKQVYGARHKKVKCTARKRPVRRTL